MVVSEFIRATFDDAVEEAVEEAGNIDVPGDITKQVEGYLRKNPTKRWDQAVADIARNRDE